MTRGERICLAVGLVLLVVTLALVLLDVAGPWIGVTGAAMGAAAMERGRRGRRRREQEEQAAFAERIRRIRAGEV